MTPERFKALTQWIEGVALVGELNTSDTETILHALDQYTLDYLQLTYPITLPNIKYLTIPIVLKLNLQVNEQWKSLQLHTIMDSYMRYIKYFLLDNVPGSKHKTLPASLQTTINYLANRFPILQGYHINPKNLPVC